MKRNIKKTEVYDKVLAYAERRAEEESAKMFSEVREKDWEVIKMSDENDQPIRLAIFEFTKKDGSIIYSVSDEEGYLFSPANGEIKLTNIDLQPLNKKSEVITGLKESKGYFKILEHAKKYASKNNVKYYSPNFYKHWDLSQMSNKQGDPFKFSVFHFTFPDGTVVYSVTDEDGYLFIPPSDEGATISGIEEEPLSFNNQFKTYAMIGGVILILLMSIFGPSLANYLRAKNDPLRKAHISAAKSFNSAREKLLFDWQKQEKDLGSFYVYTNDTVSEIWATMRPNLEFYENKNDISYVASQGHASTMEQFLKRKDTAGYNVILNSASKKIPLMKMTKLDEEQKFIYKNRYYYTDKEKAALTSRIEKKPDRKFRYPYDSKEDQLSALEGEQRSKIIFTESELEDQEVKDNLRMLFAPRVRKKGVKGIFYFTFYNKNMSKEDLNAKIQDFENMFFKGVSPKGSVLKKIDLKRTAPSI